MVKAIQRVVVWGDSVARGVVYDEGRKRYTLAPQPAAALVCNKLGIELVNRSRMGMTSDGGAEMLKKDLERGVEGDVAVLEFGGNDADFDWKEISEHPEREHLPRTPIERYEENMLSMIQTVKDANMVPVLVNLTPVNADRYFDFICENGLSGDNILKWLGSKFQIYRYQERYSLSVSRLARENGCKLLDIRSAFLNVWDSATASLFCHDGIHPTAKGQQLMGEAILKDI